MSHIIYRYSDSIFSPKNGFEFFHHDGGEKITASDVVEGVPRWLSELWAWLYPLCENAERPHKKAINFCASVSSSPLNNAKWGGWAKYFLWCWPSLTSCEDMPRMGHTLGGVWSSQAPLGERQGWEFFGVILPPYLTLTALLSFRTLGVVQTYRMKSTWETDSLHSLRWRRQMVGRLLCITWSKVST